MSDFSRNHSLAPSSTAAPATRIGSWSSAHASKRTLSPVVLGNAAFLRAWAARRLQSLPKTIVDAPKP